MVRAAIAAAPLLLATPLMAEDVRITTFKPTISYTLNGQTFEIARVGDPTHVVSGEMARTSRPCPPDCVLPQTIADGVETVAELELLDFMQNEASDGLGLLVDTRMPGATEDGMIPGSVGIPHVILSPENRFRQDILLALGATASGDVLNFENAMTLMIYAGGSWDSAGKAGVEHLLDAGYPPEKLLFYRGGMQAWSLLGLTASSPQNPG